MTLFLSKQGTHSLVGKSCCRLVSNPVGLWQMILFPPVRHFQAVHEARIYAVPYQQILTNIAFGYGQLYYGPWSPSFPWFNKKIS